MIKVALQITGREDDDLRATDTAMKEVGLEPIYFGLVPFAHEVTNREKLDPLDSFIPFGTTLMIRMIYEGKFPKGAKIFYKHREFDQSYYKMHLGPLLLNYDSDVYELSDIKNMSASKPMFIKPTSDLKAFPGMVIGRDGPETLAEALAKVNHDSSLSDSTRVLCAPLKQIEIEFRCVVIAGKLVDCCAYKDKDRVKWQAINETDRKACEIFFARCKDMYEPHANYVIDFARVDDQLKVIEYNCFNCSGLYVTDRKKIFEALIAAEG